MFRAFHCVQEPDDFRRARHNGEFLRLPAGWDVVFDDPRPFEGDGIDKPQSGPQRPKSSWPPVASPRPGKSAKP